MEETNGENIKMKKKHKKRKFKDVEEDSTEQVEPIEKISTVKKSKKREKRKSEADNNECVNSNPKLKSKADTVVNDGPDSEDETTNVSAPISESLIPSPTSNTDTKVSMLRPNYMLDSNTEATFKNKEKVEKKNNNFNISNLWQNGHSNNNQESKNSKTRNHDNQSNDYERPAFKNSYNNNSNKSNNFVDQQELFPKRENRWQKREEYTFAEELKCTSNTRQYTVSIAVPASILQQTCPLDKFKTYVVGQLSRSASIYCVDEIIVYNDNCWRNNNEEFEQYIAFMKMILEYQECPQYMKRQLFPMHSYLKDVGVLSVLNAPHHLLASEWCTYREGIVLERTNGKFSCVNVGLRSEVDIDRKLVPNVRVTVKFPPEARTMRRYYGSVVSPDEPRTKGGLYWGYTVRIADSLSGVMKSERFKDGYDLVIGTSDKGDPIGKAEFKTFSHALIVFGGVDGLEAAMETDSEITEKKPKKYFQKYLNTCPNQGSKTIRTEEAVLLSLCRLAPKFKRYGNKVMKK